MRRWKKTAVCGVVFLAALVIALLWLKRSYYPMGGEAEVIGKEYDGSAYHIAIKHGRGGYVYTLKCSREQFEAVCVGEMIDCDRYQSVMTHRGIVMALRCRGSEWIRIPEEDWVEFRDSILW